MNKGLNYIKTTLDFGSAYTLLQMCDQEFQPSLSQTMDLKKYAQKLSEKAQFVLALDKGEMAGFVAYYLNDDGHFIYVPLIWVSKVYQRKGIGQNLIGHLSELALIGYSSICLEVLKTNTTALAFYKNEKFEEEEDRGEKFLLKKILS